MVKRGHFLNKITVLIKQAVEGDQQAFREIYDQLAGKMYSLCLRYAGNQEDANDLFQEGFIKLYRNLPGFRGEGSFEGWARRIFVTTCLDYIKKDKLYFSEVEDNQYSATKEMNGFDKLALGDLMEQIKKMPEGYRTVFNLYLVDGYSHKEIGNMLGITESSSKSQLRKAKLYLHNKLTSLE